MRILPILALLLLATVEQAKGQSQIQKLVAEYVDPATGAERRKAIAGELRPAPAVRLRAPLVPALAREATRGAALDLALALRVPGLFSTVRRLIDAEEQRVSLLLVATRDRGATAFLADRWRKAAPGGASEKLLTAAFLAHRVEARTMLRFHAALLDEERKAAAGRILKYQMGLATGDPAQIAARWPVHKRELLIAATPFRLRGTDLLQGEGVELDKCLRIDGNVRLNKYGKLAVTRFPAWIDTCQSFRLTLRVYLPAAEKALVRLENSKGTGFALQIENDKWAVTINDKNRQEAPVVKGGWNEFVYVGERLSRVTNKERPKDASREINCWANKGQLLKAAWFDHQAGKLIVRCAQEWLVVGGVELLRVK